VLRPRFSASTFLDSARRHGATEFNAIGAMLEILMRQPERDDDADTPLRLCYTGPAPPRQRQIEIEERFGLRIVCGYALSESPYGILKGVVDSTAFVKGEWGAEIVDSLAPQEGDVVVEGKRGELELRNPAVMRGYWDMPEETAQAVSSDGWLRTGDLVHRNPDGTTVRGTREGGHPPPWRNVAPAEIEEASAPTPT
jgi:crotonobetaine/carnitine-CoA ligase